MSLKDFLNISRSGGKGRFRPVTVAVHQREEQDSKVLKWWGEGGEIRRSLISHLHCTELSWVELHNRF